MLIDQSKWIVHTMERLDRQYPSHKITDKASLIEFQKKPWWNRKTSDEIVLLHEFKVLGQLILQRQYEDKNVSEFYPFCLWPREYEYQKQYLENPMNPALSPLRIQRTTFYLTWCKVTAEVKSVSRALQQAGCYFDMVNLRWVKDYRPIVTALEINTESFLLAVEGSPIFVPIVKNEPERRSENVHSDSLSMVTDSAETLSKLREGGEINEDGSYDPVVMSAPCPVVFKRDSDDDTDIRHPLNKSTPIKIEDGNNNNNNNAAGSGDHPENHAAKDIIVVSGKRKRKSPANGAGNLETVRHDPSGLVFTVDKRSIGKTVRGVYVYGPKPRSLELPVHDEVPTYLGQVTLALGGKIRFQDMRYRSDDAVVISVSLFCDDGSLVKHCGYEYGPFGHGQFRPITVQYNVKGPIFNLTCTGDSHVIGHYVMLYVAFWIIDQVVYVRTPRLLVREEGAVEMYAPVTTDVPIGAASDSPGIVSTVHVKQVDMTHRGFADYLQFMTDYGGIDLTFTHAPPLGKRWIFALRRAIDVDCGDETSVSAVEFCYDVNDPRNFMHSQKGVAVQIKSSGALVRTFPLEINFQMALRKVMHVCRKFYLAPDGIYLAFVPDFDRIVHKVMVDWDKHFQFRVVNGKVKIPAPP